jgi:hypothetical protein
MLVDRRGIGNHCVNEMTNRRGVRTRKQPLKKSNQSAAVTLRLW